MADESVPSVVNGERIEFDRNNRWIDDSAVTVFPKSVSKALADVFRCTLVPQKRCVITVEL